MARQKAKELNNQKDGDRNACPICNPNPKRIPLWKVWKWSKANPNVKWYKENENGI